MRKLLWGIIAVGAAVIAVSVLLLIKTLHYEKAPQKTEDEIQITVSEPDMSEEEKSPIDGRIICIDPGHGKTSRKEKEPIYPGASEKKATNVSGASGRLMSEEELNLMAGEELFAALSDAGAVVYMTRTTHECDMSNIERAEFANQKNADLVIRLHADGSESGAVSGMSMLLPDKSRRNGEYLTEAVVEKSRRAGELILAEVTSRTGAQDRGMVTRPDMTGFNWSKVPVVLLEMGFMTNAEEEKKLSDSAYRAKLVEGIVAACEKYFSEY